MTEDPRAIIARSPMRPMQMLAVAMCMLLNALDGFDVLSISFASPGIAADWNVERAALGLVLSMELIGMAAGSIVLGALCDRIGRRPTVLLCLVVMAGGMGLAATAGNVTALSACRLVTGVGIGGMLAVTAAIVAEVANDRSRNLCVALMAGGYPAGAVVGGTIASALLVDGTWRSVFRFGAIATAICIPLAWLLLSETIAWLAQKHSAGALSRINHALATYGHAPVDVLPSIASEPETAGMGRLFARNLAPITILVTLAYFAHILTFYFILKWTPKIVADMGFAPSLAGGVLVWANVGGVAGAIVLSLLAQRFDVRRLVIGAMLLSVVFVSLFGRSPRDITSLSMLAAAAGFCTNAGVVGLYALFTRSFPTPVRASGTGFAIGIGRGGAALSPILAGVLFSVGVGLPTIAIAMACGSAVGIAALILLGRLAHTQWRTLSGADDGLTFDTGVQPAMER